MNRGAPALRVTDRLLAAGVIVAYLALVKWAYIARLAPEFGYTGLRYVDPGLFQESLSWLFALLPLFWLPMDVDRPSRLPLWFQYLVVYLPVTCIPLYNFTAPQRTVWPLVTAVLLALMIMQGFGSLPALALSVPRISPGAFRLLLVGLGLVLLVPIAMTFGVSLHLPSLSEVYGVRSEYRETLTHANPITGYAVAWFGSTIMPLLIVDGLVNRRWWVIIVGMLGEALVFSISASKSVALSGFFIAALWVIYRPGGRRMGLFIAASLTGIVLLSIIADMFGGGLTLASLFIRRALVTPGLLTGEFYEFYSGHPLILMGSSVLRPLAGYQYDAAPAYVIGSVYFGDSTIAANVNIWGDAFANFGLTGIIVFAVLFGAVLWLFDSLARGRSPSMTCLMLGFPAFMLTNSAFQTVLLTHGLGLTLCLALLLPSRPVAASESTRA
ncbi:MAG TPA: hypothetical protein VJN95_15410 [Gemmatimonadales bacterium]|nr:hypothetical protein [Gemmatimonadales bacterium]